MSLHLQRDLDQLKKEILQLGGMVEQAIGNAILALNDQRVELTELVFDQEFEINDKEVLIEEHCLKILALHQPVAADLRFIVVVLKVNNDLERMGDFAENIAQRAVFLAGKTPISPALQIIDEMSKCIEMMIRGSLNALVSLDVELAKRVMAMDDQVDAMNSSMYDELQTLMENDQTIIKESISLLSTSRYLERIADLATNICEDTVFMVDGEVIRHRQKHPTT